jgi:hypothetical protein
MVPLPRFTVNELLSEFLELLGKAPAVVILILKLATDVGYNSNEIIM